MDPSPLVELLKGPCKPLLEAAKGARASIARQLQVPGESVEPSPKQEYDGKPAYESSPYKEKAKLKVEQEVKRAMEEHVRFVFGSPAIHSDPSVLVYLDSLQAKGFTFPILEKKEEERLSYLNQLDLESRKEEMELFSRACKRGSSLFIKFLPIPCL